MSDRVRFVLSRLSERLWVKPLAMCLLAIIGAFVARSADHTGLGEIVPDITPDSINTLLTVMSASMLVIATFSVGAMVSAYASVSSTATPRAFSLVIADDSSQNALSAFVGAFIFSLVSLLAVENEFFDRAGRFALFVLTTLVFALVIVTFVRWVDSVARLGRLGTTVDKVEAATAAAMRRWKRAPTLGAGPVTARPEPARGVPLYAARVGYVQRVDVAMLQEAASRAAARIELAALPGAFAAPGRPIAYVRADREDPSAEAVERMRAAFSIGDKRTYDEDPRFGLVVLSEIAGRALSPGINDPGTAIDVIGTLVRLFALWGGPAEEEPRPVEHDRVEVPELSVDDMFEDAFTAIARDGAGSIEVVVRLQKAFHSLASIPHPEMQAVVPRHSRRALARAEKALDFSHDLHRARNAAGIAGTPAAPTGPADPG